MEYKRTFKEFQCIDMKYIFDNVDLETKKTILSALKTDIIKKLPNKYLPNDTKINEKLSKQNINDIDIDKNFITPYNLNKKIFFSSSNFFQIEINYFYNILNEFNINISNQLLNDSKIKREIGFYQNNSFNNSKIIKTRDTLIEKLTYLINEEEFTKKLQDEVNNGLIISIDFENSFCNASKKETLRLIENCGLNNNKSFMNIFEEAKTQKRKIEIPTEFAYYIHDNNSKKRYMEHVLFSPVARLRHRDNVPTYMSLSIKKRDIDNYLQNVTKKFKDLNKPLIFVGLGISSDLSILKPYLKKENIQYKVIDLKDLIQTISSNDDLALSNLVNMYLKTSNGKFIEYNKAHNPLNDCIIGVNVFNNVLFGEQTKSILNDKKVGIDYINLFEEFIKLSDCIDTKDYFAKIDVYSFAIEVENSIKEYFSKNKINIDDELINPIITYCKYMNFYNNNNLYNKVNLNQSFNFLNDVLTHLKENFKELNEQDIKGIKNYLKYDITEQSIYYPKHL